MPTDVLYLLGAGGHAKVVIDTLEEAHFDMRRVHVRDDAVAKQGQTIIGFEVNVPAITASMSNASFHIAIGNCSVRQKLFLRLNSLAMQALTIVHPAAMVSRHAKVGDGSFVAARAIVAASARVGRNVIINHGAIVDHDCVVGDFCHIAPNASLAGDVQIGIGVLIGSGANILPGVKIGEGAVIGAGAVVVSDVEAHQVQVGMPAKKLKGK